MALRPIGIYVIHILSTISYLFHVWVYYINIFFMEAITMCLETIKSVRQTQLSLFINYY